MSAPQWAPVDDATSSLLTLVADAGHVSADYEWGLFAMTLAAVADRAGGVISPNALRPMIRGHIAPRRIGAFTNRALSQGLVEYTGEWETSDDTEGRNRGKPARVMRWIGSAS